VGKLHGAASSGTSCSDTNAEPLPRRELEEGVSPPIMIGGGGHAA